MTSQKEERPWHSIEVSDALVALDSAEEGLTSIEARKRLQSFGPNILPRKAPTPVVFIFLRQFRNPLIYILSIAAVVSLSIGDFKDAGFILAVLLLNAVIGGYQELRAEAGARALEKFLKIHALVLRDKEELEVEAEQLVPGDLVLLESGNRVPADLRLISTQGLEVDESLLSGESLAVLKDAQWQGNSAAAIADQLNMAFAGSIVARGRGYGVVVSTGSQSQIGKLALDVISGQGGQPPLVTRLEAFTRVVAWVAVGSAIFLGSVGVVLHGHSPVEMLMFGIALAVSAIPEGLPIAITVALSIAASRMAARNVIVRRLKAVEGLGSCTLIATDKTGTLTCNELTVKKILLADGNLLDVEGEGFAPVGKIAVPAEFPQSSAQLLESLIEIGTLCNEADLHLREGEWIFHGDPTDIALLTLGHKAGLNRAALDLNNHQVHEIPFEPERQFAATFFEHDSRVRIFVKGAPERVLAMCVSGREERELIDKAESLAADGYRVLAMALGEAERGEEFPQEPRDLKLAGFVGMIDPLRPGVKQAISDCQAAGVKVSMVTGDHPVTALAIARQLGLAESISQTVSGQELADLSAEDLKKSIDKTRVFARSSPAQKLEIVSAAQRAGHVVAVTGDGVNDAPALQAANIGIAMGKSGTDVAREASELVIADDNFATIVAGIEEGRVAYDNVRKVTYLLVSTGACEILLLGAALLAGLPLPLLPAQILWLNLVTNGIQDVALAFEPGEDDVLKRKPRAVDEKIFDRLMIERTIIGGLVMSTVTFISFFWMLQQDWEIERIRNSVLLLMVLFQNIQIGNCRSETKSAFVHSPLRNPILLFGTIFALAVHLLAINVPFTQGFLQTRPVEPMEVLTLLGLALTVLAALELHKISWRFRQ